MRPDFRIALRAAALALSLLLTACASVRIDVDVYKGPLANGPNVQALKLAELAVSAKQLLVTLRDEMEWANHVTDEQKIFHAVNEGRKNVKYWWRADYVPHDPRECDVENSNGRCFQTDRAARINDALCTLSSMGNLAACPPTPGAPARCGSVESELMAMRGDDKPLAHATRWACLRAGLVAFSEQMLVFSNSEALVAQRSPLKSIIPFFDLNARQRRLDRYVALLQSLGNAIQVQLDDLEQRKAHEQQAAAGANTEWLALQTVAANGSTSAEGVMQGFLDKLGRDRDAAGEEAAGLAGEEIAAGSVATQAATSALTALVAVFPANQARIRAQLTVDELVAVQPAPLGARSLGDWPVPWSLDAFRVLAGTTGPDVPEAPEKPASAELGSGAYLALEAGTSNGAGAAFVDDVIAAITRWQASRITAALPSAERNPWTDRVTRAREFLDEAKKDPGLVQKLTPGSARSRYKALREWVEGVLHAQLGQLTSARDRLAEATRNARKAEQESARRDDDGHAAAVKLTRIRNEHSASNQRIVDLTTAIAKVDQARPTVLAKAAAGKIGPDATALHGLLAMEIAANAKSAPPADQPAWNTAATIVASHLKPSRVPDPGAAPAADETRTDIMDRLIAQLRHELIQARKMSDKNKVTALEGALREAYDQRAAMIYLRPATSYLRSVSAASLFQENAELSGKSNLLVPDFLNPYNLPRFLDSRGAIREDVDKQFWSNINRVNVTGGGDTNYVIAKDDVGNWYVKGYSADPTSVFKSAQGLGLFALGGRMNTNLVSWLEQDRELKDELGKATDDTKKKNLRDQIQNLNKQRPAASNDALQGLYEKYRDNYVAALSDTERALDEFFRDSAAGSDGLRTKAKTAWDGKTSAVAAVNLTDEDFTVAFDESYATLGSKISVFLANHAEQTNGSPQPPASARSLRERGAAALALLNGLRAFSEAFGMKITAIEAETANRKAAHLNVETSMAALKKARQLRDEAAGAAASSEQASKVLVDSTSLKELHDKAVAEKSRTESALSAAQTDYDNAVKNSRNRDKAVTAVVGAVQSVANGEARGVAMKLQKASSQFETALGFIEESAAGK